MENPHRLLLLAALSALAPTVSFSQPAAAPPVAKASWKVSADQADGLYQTGETATFTVKLAEGSPIAPDGELFWRTDKDGVAPFSKGSVKLQGGSGTFTAKLDEPGFLQGRVSNEIDGKLVTEWGVGVSPLELKRSLPIPEDFDAFWNGQLEKLAAVPINPELRGMKSGMDKEIEFYDVKLGCPGKRVSGYFGKPVNSKAKSLPAILTVQGAGVRDSDAGGVKSWASRGMLAMDINAHGIENGMDAAFYEDLAKGELNNYRQFGRESREGNYFTGMFLRAKRALDFLCSQPEWDGKTLVVFGGSQGGFQAFAAAALDERVSMMVAMVPAGCDHSGMVANRVAGWPKIVPVKDGKPDAAVLEASRYIDNVNFAARSKAEVAVVSTGFVDGVCPPTSVYVAFNELPMKDKQIINDLGAGHSVEKKTAEKVRALVMRHVKR